MPAEYVGRRPLVSEHAELTSPINRDPEQPHVGLRRTGDASQGRYGVFRQPVRLPSGEVVDAAVKIFPGELAARYEQ